MTDSENNSSSTSIIRIRANDKSELEDIVAVEEPLEIRLGFTDQHKGRIHKSISITMRTPGDDVNLACGFLFSESIISNISDIDTIDDSAENVIRIELNEDRVFDLSRIDRHFYTTSSCGVCGKASLEALSTSGYDALLDNTFTISQKNLCGLGAKLRDKQSLFHQTGGCHATGTFNADGNVIDVTEDVGRHNAMDKLIGSMLRSRLLPMQNMGIIVSGRTSFELIQKALVAGCPMLVSVGAPSSLAIGLAEEFNITLIGFLSSTGFNLYHGNLPE
ncbi:MAG: formate dehydrogenase accessory sulfurtransferase FdhD [Gammaproteobacteria bacterium]|nr:formate dehydrogenase accessory sulfurtransferase FdhD [Gammaproteobacteria bacterium]